MQLLPLFVSDVYQVAKELVTQVKPVGIQNVKVEMKSACRLSSAKEFGIREKTVTRFTVQGRDGLAPMGIPAEDRVLQLNGWIKTVVHLLRLKDAPLRFQTLGSQKHSEYLWESAKKKKKW